MYVYMCDMHTHTCISFLSWFAVHCTSMNNTNRLISGDNKGHASYLMEKAINGPGTLPGQVGGESVFMCLCVEGEGGGGKKE